jgi:hypothetical protein
MQWGNILVFEFIVIALIIWSLGYIKLPRWMRRRQLAKGFPWGGMEGFGDFGEFSGFGEMGEFGAHFGAGGHAGTGE